MPHVHLPQYSAWHTAVDTMEWYQSGDDYQFITSMLSSCSVSTFLTRTTRTRPDRLPICGAVHEAILQVMRTLDRQAGKGVACTCGAHTMQQLGAPCFKRAPHKPQASH